MATIQKKYEQLQTILGGMDRALVAFSGGVDSTFLLKVARMVLGDQVLAVTATSETLPSAELAEAKALARSIGAAHRIIRTNELDRPGYDDNTPQRCYFCKTELYEHLSALARELHYETVLDGSNVDDLGDWRPGRKAALEHKVRSPLQEADLTKDDIRALSRDLGLPTWEKQSFACLSSRFPYGEKITVEKLKQVDAAENVLRSLQFTQFRVRHHGDIARLELGPTDFERLFRDGLIEQVTQRLKALGYCYVTLDLEGFRSGSMNEPLLKRLRQANDA
ncbi:ATP-dependent sacrificial sulfur transferase LarE [Nitrospinae bacterium AH_259_B05_G02_I21]|nr:ATP-dependent sacrificial sulfur transferase LarE [Nitrospinae bacterium AH_259_B05_G02_I21]